MRRGSFGKAITLIVVIALLYIVFLNIPQFFKLLYPLHFEEAILEYAEKYQIDPTLVAAVIKTESNFYTFAESPKGARGLMQITPSTGKWIAEKLSIDGYSDDMLYEPELNIGFGCWYISHLCKYYSNDYKLVLAAYNGGMGNVDKWLKDISYSSDGNTLDKIPFTETDGFVKKVNRNYNIYSKLYEWTKNTKDDMQNE